MITTIRKEFMEEYKNLIFGTFIQNLKDTGLEDTFTSINTPLVQIKAGVSNMQMSSARLRGDNIHLDFSEKSPVLTLRTEKIGLNFTFNYLLDAKPNIINDKGLGQAYFNSLKMMFGINPFVTNSLLNV